MQKCKMGSNWIADTLIEQNMDVTRDQKYESAIQFSKKGANI